MPIKPWTGSYSVSCIMKVTSFHMANKVEEAVQSYFINSFVFSSRKIDVERTADFRNNVTTLQFFLHDGDERVPMGGIEFLTIAEQGEKIAIQWRSNILPAGTTNHSFMILSSGRDQYEEYTKLADILKKGWEKDINSYLPKNEELPPPVVEAPKTVEDEYASLSPEEIEAITGVKPEPKGAPSAAAKEEKHDESASDDDIKRIMGMVNSSPAIKHEDKPAAASPASETLSEAEIAALAHEVAGQSTGSATTENVEPPPAKREESSSEEMSAEDIWRQINGGK
jgi:hypothetical protein